MAHAIALILPFEPELYRRHGAHAVFVGHPLLDRPDEGAEPQGGGRTGPGPWLRAWISITRNRSWHSSPDRGRRSCADTLAPSSKRRSSCSGVCPASVWW